MIDAGPKVKLNCFEKTAGDYFYPGTRESFCRVVVFHESLEGRVGFILEAGGWCEEGNGNPLLYSCRENSMDRGAWRATVHGVAGVRQDLATKERERGRW